MSNQIGASIANGSIVTAGVAVSVTAEAIRRRSKALAGGIDGAGTTAVGAALSTNDMGDSDTATVNNSTFIGGTTVTVAPP